MTIKLANNATSRLAVSISSSDTQFSVSPGEGSRFPSLSPGDWFPLTIVKSNGELEIVKCTARSGDVFTVDRAQESTSANSFNVNDRVELRITEKTLDEKFTQPIASAQQAADNAQQAADNAQQAADNAQQAADNAQQAADNAQQAADNAQDGADASLKKALNLSDLTDKVVARSSLELGTAALASAQSLSTDHYGPTEPSIKFPGMTWADSTNLLLKRRNAANDAWVVEGRLLKNHMPIFIEADIPETDIGPIYVIGNGTYEWSGTGYVQLTPSVIDIFVPRFIKPDEFSPAFLKTSAATISIKAGSALPRFGVLYSVDTAVTMPALVAGTDYSIWAAPDGALQAVEDKFITPATPPVTDAIKIGGFHYGLVASGTTPASGSFSTAGITSGGGSFGWTQSDVDKLAGINEFSIWDLTWRCKGEQRGMTFDPLKQAWVGIYFMSDSPHIHGPSAYNTNVASGTVLPYIPAKWGGNGVLKYSRLSAFEAHELVSAFGLRLITYDEFMSAAFGVTEGQSLGGAASTIPATARQPGYTSRIGVEQATGHQWVIGGPIKSVGGSAWADIGRGSWYGSSGLVLLGGNRANAADSGSRCAAFNNALSYLGWSVGVRAAGDHVNLGRAAR